jgi:hypothetical protein
MNMWRVREDMGSKETDRCPLTIMANCNAAMAAAAASMTQTETSKGTLVEREVDNTDFVRSSR